MFIFVASYCCNIAKVKHLSGPRNRTLVERPCIPCLDSSRQIATLELTKKFLMAYKAKDRAKCLNMLEKAERVGKETCFRPAKRGVWISS